MRLYEESQRENQELPQKPFQKFSIEWRRNMKTDI